jgi:hypothetical protein
MSMQLKWFENSYDPSRDGAYNNWQVGSKYAKKRERADSHPYVSWRVYSLRLNLNKIILDNMFDASWLASLGTIGSYAKPA